LFIGHNETGAVRLPADDLLTHGVVLGRTGSGKSGLTIALLEEVTKSGANAIVLDPKGDLTNLALSLSSEAEFARWVEDNPTEARLRHGEGLAESGLGFEDVRRWRDKVDVGIYAPGKTNGGGRAVCVLPEFEVPRKPPVRENVSRQVGAVLRNLGASDDPYDPAQVFMTSAVIESWLQNRPLPVSEWPGMLTNPPERLAEFGGMKLNDFFPKRQRTKLARTLIGFCHEADRWLQGDDINLRALVKRPKPSIAVFSLRHLTEEDRQFFGALLMNKVVEFMFETEASDSLKLLVVLDEARGYLPPHPYNPPTKDPICTVLAQGRAQGVGMLIGTQNPMDLDYKALSNVGSWFVGRLRERDCARDLVAELQSRNVEMEDVADTPQRSFLLLDKRGGHQTFRTRWCLNYLFGPMSGPQLEKLDGEDQEVRRPKITAAPRQETPCVKVKPREKRPSPAPAVVPTECQEVIETKPSQTGKVMICLLLWALLVLEYCLR